MANATKIRKTLDVIEANQHRWKQDAWASGPVNPDTQDWQECGSSFCIAGWCCVLDGLRPRISREDGCALGVFYDPANPNTLINPATYATDQFELTEYEAAALFQFFTTDFAVMRQHAEEVIAGEFADEDSCGFVYCDD